MYDHLAKSVYRGFSPRGDIEAGFRSALVVLLSASAMAARSLPRCHAGSAGVLARMASAR